MSKQTLAENNEPASLPGKKIAINAGLGFILLALFSGCLFVFVTVGLPFIGFGSFLWCGLTSKTVKIDEIPMYPNAQNIVYEKPPAEAFEFGTWTFTTTDDPDTVWKFYVDEMGRKWGFTKSSSETLVLLNACQDYTFKMTSQPMDTVKYLITITVDYEPYR
jgi:hypothetical protein